MDMVGEVVPACPVEEDGAPEERGGGDAPMSIMGLSLKLRRGVKWEPWVRA